MCIFDGDEIGFDRSSEYSSVDEVMRCSFDGSTYYWRPQRTDYAIDAGTTSGNVTLTPLLTAPILKYTATLLGVVNITPANTNVWPGCSFVVTAPSALGIFSMNITGLIGGVTTLLAGSSREITYTSSGWRA